MPQSRLGNTVQTYISRKWSRGSIKQLWLLYIILKLLYFTHTIFPQILLAILIALFLIPAAIFTCLEDQWGYLDSMYYCFVSLTTVGLGDFIPGDTPGQHLRPLYKACTTCELSQSLVQTSRVKICT